MPSFAPTLSPGAGRRSPLWTFLLASLLVHALVVILWTGEPPSGMAGGGVLQVRLERGATTGAEGERTDEAVAPLPEPEERRPDAEPGPALSGVEIPSRPTSRATGEAPPQTKAEGPPSTKRRAARVSKEPKRRRAEPQSPAEPAFADKSREDGGEEMAAEQRLVGGSAVYRGSEGQPAGSDGASPAEGKEGGAGGEAHRMVQTALREALLTRFEYPLLARRRGWEGRVRIALLVEPDGRLRDLQVVQSSGYQVLDEAALENLRAVGLLPEAKAWLGGRGLDVILPVQYRLR